MAIRHVVTIQVAPGRAADFAGAFKPVQAIAQRQEAASNTSCFKAWTTPTGWFCWSVGPARRCSTGTWRPSARATARLSTPVMALWAPGRAPTIERFEV